MNDNDIKTTVYNRQNC